MFTIVGLGNIGEEYVGTRHNVGRDIVMAWVKEKSGSFFLSKKHRGLLWEGLSGDEKVRAFLPECFMNESGGPVHTLVSNKKHVEMLVVVHDDLDLPLGTMRVVSGRGAGGHNGVASIIKALKTNEFIRVRVGISPHVRNRIKKPQGKEGVYNWVLGTFSSKEQKMVREVSHHVYDLLDHLIMHGVTSAMNAYNKSLS